MSELELEQLKQSVYALQKVAEQNNISIKHLEEKTKDIVDAFHSAKSAFKVLEFIGAIAKPVFFLISTATACYAVLSYFKTVIK